jgi:hypothetical protein
MIAYGAHDQPATAWLAGQSERGGARACALGYVTGASATSLARVNLGEILFRRGDCARGRARLKPRCLRSLNEHASPWLARSYGAGRPAMLFVPIA